eukprot:357202-Chlamydomonas_euryale.AAC.24
MFSAPLKCLVGNDPPNFGIPIFRLSTVYFCGNARATRVSPLSSRSCPKPVRLHSCSPMTLVPAIRGSAGCRPDPPCKAA